MASSTSYSAHVLVKGGSIGDDKIQSIHITQSACDGNYLTISTATSSVMEIELINVSKDTLSGIKKNSPITVTIQATRYTPGDPTPTITSTTIGGFYVSKTEAKRASGTSNAGTAILTNYNATITAYDGFSKMSKLFDKGETPEVLETIEVKSLIEMCCSACGITYKTEEWESNQQVDATVFPETATYRDVVAELAGVMGGVAYFDFFGMLRCRWYDSPTSEVSITSDQIYLDGLEFGSSGEEEEGEGDDSASGDGDIVKISKIVCKTDVGTFSFGGDSGDKISFSNILLSKGRVYEIYSNWNENLKPYTPLTVKWTGDLSTPLISRIKVTDRSSSTVNAYLMEREIFYDGSLYEVYKSFPPSQAQVEERVATSVGSSDWNEVKSSPTVKIASYDNKGDVNGTMDLSVHSLGALEFIEFKFSGITSNVKPTFSIPLPGVKMSLLTYLDGTPVYSNGLSDMTSQEVFEAFFTMKISSQAKGEFSQDGLVVKLTANDGVMSNDDLSFLFFNPKRTVDIINEIKQSSKYDKTHNWYPLYEGDGG